MKKKQKWIALFLGVTMVFGGCGNGTDGDRLKEGQKAAGTESGLEMIPDGEVSQVDIVTNQNAQGRYVDEITDMTGELFTGMDLAKLENGDLVILDQANGKYVSKDEGATWVHMDEIDAICEKNYMMEMATAQDGTMVLEYNPFQEEIAGEENEVEEEVKTSYELVPEYLLIKPDGEQKAFQVESTDNNNYVSEFYWGPEQKLYALMLGDYAIYEIDVEHNSKKKVHESEEAIENLFFTDELVFVQGQKECTCYCLSNWEEQDCSILNEFIQEQYGGQENAMICFQYCMTTDEQGAIYVAGSNGLHRYQMGGTVMEQIINGKLSTLGDPSHELMGFLSLGENRYAGLFSDGKYARFVYDETMPSVPSDQLTIYSLEENETIKQAISIYQTSHPDLFVQYEVGMSGNNAITREDALKTLNTRLMAGEGPDLLVMDGMPMDFYVEKGVLADVSDLYEKVAKQEAIFDNLVQPFYQKEALYVIPCEVEIPVIAGKKEIVEGIGNLSEWVDAYEKLATEKKEDLLLYAYTEEGTLRKMFPVCEMSLINEDGSVNQKNLEEFLNQSKRMHTILANSAILQEKIPRLNQMLEENEGVSYEMGKYFFDLNCMSYMEKTNDLFYGLLGNDYAYMQLISLVKNKGFEQSAFQPFDGQGDAVYVPKTLIGINAGSSNQMAAENFLEGMLGVEIQKKCLYGFGINQKALEALFDSSQIELGPNLEHSTLCTSDEEGNFVELSIFFPNEEEKKQVKELLASRKNPSLPNLILEEALYQEGPKYMQGKTTLMEAVNAIVEKVEIYGAE